MARISVAYLMVLSCAIALLPCRVSAQESKVGFRADYTVLVGERPFFPVGLIYCNEDHSLLSALPLPYLWEHAQSLFRVAVKRLGLRPQQDCRGKISDFKMIFCDLDGMREKFTGRKGRATRALSV